MNSSMYLAFGPLLKWNGALEMHPSTLFASFFMYVPGDVLHVWAEEEVVPDVSPETQLCAALAAASYVVVGTAVPQHLADQTWPDFPLTAHTPLPRPLTVLLTTLPMRGGRRDRCSGLLALERDATGAMTVAACRSRLSGHPHTYVRATGAVTSA